MNRTILSLALLKVNWSKGVDYIDCFLPLLVSTIISSGTKTIDINDVSKIKKEILKEYGLDIPSSALITILNRAKKRDYFTADSGIYLVNEDKINLDDNSKVRAEINRAYNYVIKELQKFITEHAPEGISFSDDEISDGLLAFLKNHDADISFGAENLSILPSVEAPEKLKYLICWFVVENWESDPILVNYLKDISIGHALSSLILYDEFNPFKGKLENLDIYLDTPFILSLLGINGEQRTLLSEEILSQLKNDKANVFVLQTTISEVLNNLEGCKNTLKKGNGIAQSLSVRMCIENNIRVEDIEQMMADFSFKMEGLGISENQVPDYDDYNLVINEEELFDTIIESYEKINRRDKKPRTLKKIKSSLPDHIEKTIRRDVKVLSGIYRFRKGKIPISIKDSKAIFVTTSSALAFASRVYENKLNKLENAIPTCFTDIFLSTLIWIQNPVLADQINKRRILSDCYAGMSPSEELIKQYETELKKLKERGRINSSTYLTLRTHHVAIQMLSSKTLGDPDLFGGESTAQLVNQFLDRMTEEERNKRMEVESENESLQSQNDKLENTISIRDQRLNQKADRLGLKIASLVVGLFYILITASLCIGIASLILPSISLTLQIVSFSVLTLLTIFGFSHKFSADSIKKPVVEYVRRKFLKFIE
jgi:tetrahydromethanopterin S-methyltransferase subunit G